MRAVCTDYNYKFWIHGAKGEMFLFYDDAAADAFAKEHGYFVCKTPNDMEIAYTWSRAAWSFIDCGGTVRVETAEEGCWSAIFIDGRDRKPITYEEFEDILYEEYDMPCVECWICDGSTDWESRNTGLTYEEVFGE